jgi:hypothetical protein
VFFLTLRERLSNTPPFTDIDMFLYICLSSAKLRSTDSVNPREVLSQARPRNRLDSRHRDIDGISARHHSGDNNYKGRVRRSRSIRIIGRRRGATAAASHLSVLSKAAHRDPFVCQRDASESPLPT